MMRLFLVLALWLLLGTLAEAQLYCRDASGTAVPITSSNCLALATASGAGAGALPTGTEQHNLAVVSSTALTIPTGATYAAVCAKTASVNYTWDGYTTPTSNVGFTLQPGGCTHLVGTTMLANFRAISATGTLDVAYGK